MHSELFPKSARPERLSMPDGEVFYTRRIGLPADPDVLMHRLIDEIGWRTESIVLRGRSVAQPRLVAWHGDAGRSYEYSGVRLEPVPWTPLLLEVKRSVELASGSDFNSVLLNYYRDHRDSMGYHSDDEPELGLEPVIASLTLGEERTFLMRHRSNRSIATVRLRPASGSLVIMKGETQCHWKHGVPKRTRPCGPRVNLTFRRIQDPRL